MPLSPGSRIGAYEIVSVLGAGGMGEVSRAKDSKLKREVALKVLPAGVANDRERMTRATGVSIVRNWHLEFARNRR